MKRRTKPARRIWAVWYRSSVTYGDAYYVGFHRKVAAIDMIRRSPAGFIQLVCYERREKK